MHYQVSSSLGPLVREIVGAAVDALRRLPATTYDRKQFQRSFGPLYVLDRQPGRWCVQCPTSAGVADMIEPAQHRDFPEVRRLLEQLNLPIAGLDNHLQTMIVAREGGHVVGSAALELYPDGALLRSVAVDPCWQGRQLGHQLIEAALRLAATRGANTVFLLTTTAERFFPKFGFEPITRDDVPESVRTSVEFHSACPASAIVMRKHLKD